MFIRVLIILIFLIAAPCSFAKNVTDSVQPAENLYGSVITQKHKHIVLNLISNFGCSGIPTSTIITHANNDFSIFRFEMDNKRKWHISKKDTVIFYENSGNTVVLNLQKNLEIKKNPENLKTIIIINVPAIWTGMNAPVKLTLKPWTLDRVGKLVEYNPSSLLDTGNNFRETYNSIRNGAFVNPGQIVKPEIQKEFNTISTGDVYISKGLSPLLTSRSYMASKYVIKNLK